MIVVGIDPSLAATGVAVIDLDDGLAPEVTTIRTSPGAESLTARRRRLMHILTEATRAAIYSHDTRVVIESPSLGQGRQGGTLDRHGLYWLLVDHLLAHDVPVVAVPPAVRAKYATGKGNATKGAVIDATARRFPHVDTRGDDNACDALWLAAIGAHLAGTPVVDLPVTHRDALARVTPPKEWKP